MGAVLFTAAAAQQGCVGGAPGNASSPEDLQFREGLLILDAYVQYCDQTVRRLLDDPQSLSSDEKAELAQVLQALCKISRGLNIAVGTQPQSPATQTQ